MLFEETYKKLMNDYMLNEHVVDQVPRKLLGMSTSVADLDMDKRPYGFWVDRSGNFYTVSSYGHEDGLQDILSKAEKYLTSKGVDYKPRYTYMDMINMGWLRVVVTYSTVYYQTKEGNEATSPQMKFLNFVKDIYDLEKVKKDYDRQ